MSQYREWYCDECEGFYASPVIRATVFPGEYEMLCPECDVVVAYYRELIPTEANDGTVGTPSQSVMATAQERAGQHSRRCFRCDGVGCAECLDLADFRISQEASGRATRALMESLRVCCGQPDTCEHDCPLDGAR